MPGIDNRRKEGSSGDSSPNTFVPSWFLIDFVCVGPLVRDDDDEKRLSNDGSNYGAHTKRSEQ
jgi:hypothetical protein